MSDALISYPFTEDGLRDALVALGTTPHAVATNLIGMGVTGKVNEPLCCPVANYLRASVEGARAACLGKDERSDLFAEVDREPDDESVSIPAPAAVAGFIAQFDARLFPDLIEEDSDASS